MHQPQFGMLPEGKRLALVQQSTNYKEGRFRNLVERPTLSEGHSMIGEVWNTFVKSNPNREPIDQIPSIKTSTMTPSQVIKILAKLKSIFKNYSPYYSHTF